MNNRFGEPCRWDSDAQASDHMDSLQVILNCASVQGCRDCVKCSEGALEMFLRAARESAAADAKARAERAESAPQYAPGHGVKLANH